MNTHHTDTRGRRRGFNVVECSFSITLVPGQHDRCPDRRVIENRYSNRYWSMIPTHLQGKWSYRRAEQEEGEAEEEGEEEEEEDEEEEEEEEEKLKFGRLFIRGVQPSRLCMYLLVLHTPHAVVDGRVHTSPSSSAARDPTDARQEGHR